MSAGTPAPATDRKRERIERYLRRRYDEEGPFYFKSRHVADEVGLSAKEIGALVLELSESASGPAVEKWGYTNGTTWHVVGADDAGDGPD